MHMILLGRDMDDVVHTHPNDVLITHPIRIDALNKGDVIRLPTYGESRVMCTPFFNPAHNRLLVTLIVMTKAGEKKILCARNMCFQYVCFIPD